MSARSLESPENLESQESIGNLEKAKLLTEEIEAAEEVAVAVADSEEELDLRPVLPLAGRTRSLVTKRREESRPRRRKRRRRTADAEITKLMKTPITIDTSTRLDLSMSVFLSQWRQKFLLPSLRNLASNSPVSQLSRRQ